MIPQRIAGLILLVIGVVLFIFGLNASHGFADSMSDAFTGSYTDKTMWYIIGGIVLALTGASMAFFGVGRTRNA